MNADSILIRFEPTSWSAVVRWLADGALWGVALLGLALLVTRLWRRASAAERHRVWLLALAGTVIGPVLALVVSLGGVVPEELGDGAFRAKGRFGSTGIGAALPPALVPSPSIMPVSEFGSSRPVFGQGVGEPEQAPRPIQVPSVGTAWAGAIAVMGTVLVGLRALAGRWQLARLRNRSKESEDPSWGPLLAEVAGRLGIRTKVRLRVSPDERIPTMSGIWRPVVLVPPSAAGWSAERRRAVLAHELGHVGRRDCLSQAFAETVCAVFWFHPLVWYAAGRLRVEREFACDDLVLAAGWKPSEYAGHLLDLVGSVSEIAVNPAISIGRRSGMGARVEALVDRLRPRRAAGLRLSALGVSSILVASTAWPRWIAVQAVEAPVSVASERQESISARLGTDASKGTERTDTEAEAGTAKRSGLAPSIVAADDGVRSMEAQLEQQRRTVDRWQARLEQMREQLGLEDLSGTGGERSAAAGPGEANVSKLAQAQAEVQMQVRRSEARVEQYRGLDHASLREVLLSEQPADQLLQHLCIRLADAEVELAEAGTRFGESHPEYRRIKSLVEVLDRKIEGRISGMLQGMEMQRDASRTELRLLADQAALAAKEDLEQAKRYRPYFELKRKLENERIVADMLERKLAQERFDRAIPRAKPGLGAPGVPAAPAE